MNSHIIFLLLSGIGITFIIKYGEILEYPRLWLTKIPYFGKSFFSKLLKCSMCIGFWVGVLTTYLFLDYHTYYCLYPFVQSAICWTVDIILQLIHGIDVIVEDMYNKIKKDK